LICKIEECGKTISAAHFDVPEAASRNAIETATVCWIRRLSTIRRGMLGIYRSCQAVVRGKNKAPKRTINGRTARA
jgi:hypothetical protein